MSAHPDCIDCGPERPGPANVLVKVISIWSKMTGAEAALLKRTENHEYTVGVRKGATADHTLEHAFHATNRDDRPHGTTACSTSAGDILVLDGQHYLVEGSGFRAITEAQSTAIQALTSRDTSMGLAWLIANRGV